MERFCDEAQRRGINILRDKTTLGEGELISQFMQKIGESDRVFIFLSDKYFSSPFCMFELFELWRNSRHDKVDFLRIVRLFTMDGIRIDKPYQWLEYAEFWKKQEGDLRRTIENIGWNSVGEEAFRCYRMISKFSDHVTDIFTLFADTVRPRSFDEFLEYGFEGSP